MDESEEEAFGSVTKRLADAPETFNGRELAALILDNYAEAVNARKWASATAYGKLLLAMANPPEVSAAVAVDDGLSNLFTRLGPPICWCGREIQPGENHGMRYPGME